MQLGFMIVEWLFRLVGISLFGYYIYNFVRQSKKLSKILHAETAFFEKDVTKQNLMRSFPTIEKRMQGNEILGEVWKEFDASLVKNGQLVSTTVEVDVYFNEYILVDVPLKLEIVRNIPGMLTGLGIVGTFIGVLAGLNGYDSHNVEAVRSSVINLLSGVQGAFWNSFFAISLAVLFTAMEKFYVSKLYSQVSHLQQAINRLFNRSISDDYLQRMLYQMEEQGQVMKSFSQDLSESIKVSLEELVNKQSQNMQVANQQLATAISGTLKDELGPTMDKISNVMEEVSAAQIDAGQGAMKQMISEFRETLQSSSTMQMQEMLEAISGTAQILESLKKEMDNFIGTMNVQANMQHEMVNQQIATITNQSAEGQRQMRREFTAFADTVAQNIGSLQQQMANQSSQSVKLVADELTGLVLKTQGKSGRKMQLFEDMLISTKDEKNGQMAEHTSCLTTGVAQTVQKMGLETEKLLVSSLQMNEQLMIRVGAMVKQVEGLINKTTDHSEEMYTMLKTGTEDMLNLFIQAHKLSAEYGQIVKARKGIGTSTESYKNFEQLYVLYQESGVQVEKVVEENKMLIQSLDASVTEGLDSYIRLTQQSISAYLAQLDKSLSATVNKLTTSTSGLEESLDEFSDTMESLLKSKRVG